MPSNLRSRRRGRDAASKMKLHCAMSTVALMLSNGVTPSDCFGSVSTVSNQRASTRRYFRNTFDGAAKTDGAFRSNDVKTNFLSTTLLTQDVTTSISMIPTTHKATHEIHKMPT